MKFTKTVNIKITDEDLKTIIKNELASEGVDISDDNITFTDEGVLIEYTEEGDTSNNTEKKEPVKQTKKEPTKKKKQVEEVKPIVKDDPEYLALQDEMFKAEEDFLKLRDERGIRGEGVVEAFKNYQDLQERVAHYNDNKEPEATTTEATETPAIPSVDELFPNREVDNESVFGEWKL